MSMTPWKSSFWWQAHSAIILSGLVSQVPGKSLGASVDPLVPLFPCGDCVVV